QRAGPARQRGRRLRLRSPGSLRREPDSAGHHRLSLSPSPDLGTPGQGRDRSLRGGRTTPLPERWALQCRGRLEGLPGAHRPGDRGAALGRFFRNDENLLVLQCRQRRAGGQGARRPAGEQPFLAVLRRLVQRGVHGDRDRHPDQQGPHIHESEWAFRQRGGYTGVLTAHNRPCSMTLLAPCHTPGARNGITPRITSRSGGSRVRQPARRDAVLLLVFLLTASAPLGAQLATLVKDIDPRESPFSYPFPGPLYANGDKLYFFGYEVRTGKEPWI